MSSENVVTGEVEEVQEIGACCPACGQTFLMMLEFKNLLDAVMNSPMAGMLGNAPSGLVIPGMSPLKGR